MNRLSDAQIAARLAAYNKDGEFERALALLWEDAGDLIEAAVLRSGGQEAA